MRELIQFFIDHPAAWFAVLLGLIIIMFVYLWIKEILENRNTYYKCSGDGHTIKFFKRKLNPQKGTHHGKKHKFFH